MHGPNATQQHPAGGTALQLSAARRLIANGTARQVRELAGLSYIEVARELGCSAKTIRRWEEGHTRPTGDAPVRYLELLRALADWPTSDTPAVSETENR